MNQREPIGRLARRASFACLGLFALAACGGEGVTGGTSLSSATTTTTTTTAPSATSSTTTTGTSTPTTPTVGAIPAGYTAVSASDLGVKCDGVTNDTAALQAALNGLKAYQALQLPAGTCLTSNQLNLYAKSNVMVVGAGKDATILAASDPLHSSFVVSAGNEVVLQGFQVASPNSTTRTSDANSRGFYVEKSSGVTLDGVKATMSAGAGVLFFVVTDSKVVNSEVVNSRADAFHFTGASANILVQGNQASGAGDDCFASIGYGTQVNHNIQFLDNACSDNQASGISFEGTVGGQAYRNQLTRTGVSAIRVASISGWNTGVVDQIDIRDNVLNDVKTRTDVDHSAIMVFSSLANVTNVSFSGNTIKNPRTNVAAKFINYLPGSASVSGISISRTAITSSGGVTQCIEALNVSAATSSNTLNGASC